MKTSSTNGIEKVVALANLSDDWRDKVLADPCAAADEARLELSASERAIIASVPRDTLEQMIESMRSKMSRPAGLLKAGAAAAAAALLAGSLAGCDGCSPVRTKGISPDRPPAGNRGEEAPPPPASQGIRLSPEEREELQRKREAEPGNPRTKTVTVTTGIRVDVPPTPERRPAEKEDR